MAYNSDNFNLTNWKLTLPIASANGKALEIKNLKNYENNDYFYDAADKAMVFRSITNAPTTQNSKYARSELREMDGGTEAAWSLKQGGTMTATLKIDAMPNYKDGSQGRIVVGQIHGKDQELVRLYYEKGSLYFKNDQAGSANEEMRFDFTNAKGQNPNISIREKFSYNITAKDDKLVIKVLSDGEVYTSESAINKVWSSDSFYFKAGVYMGINSSNGSGVGQASFYGLDFSHAPNSGLKGWAVGMGDSTEEEPVLTPPETTNPLNINGDNQNNHIVGEAGNDNLSGKKGNDVLIGGKGDDKLWGNEGNDTLVGGDGNDELKGASGKDVLIGGKGDDKLSGNEGNDTLVGGVGKDELKGGSGRDVFTYQSIADAGDDIFDFRQEDKLDISAIKSTFTGGGADLSIMQLVKLGYLTLERQDSNHVALLVDIDGSKGNAQLIELAMLNVEKNYVLTNDGNLSIFIGGLE